jgi:hypothetical protein
MNDMLAIAESARPMLFDSGFLQRSLQEFQQELAFFRRYQQLTFGHDGLLLRISSGQVQEG